MIKILSTALFVTAILSSHAIADTQRCEKCDADNHCQNQLYVCVNGCCTPSMTEKK